MKYGLIFLVLLLVVPSVSRAQENTPTLLAEFTIIQPSTALAWSSDTFAVATRDAIYVYDLHDFDQPPTNFEGEFKAITYRSDGILLALEGDDTALDLVDVQRGERLVTLPIESEFITAPTFNPDATILALGDDQNRIQVWDLVQGERVGILTGHEVPPNAMAFSADGRFLASAGGSGDHLVLVWDMDNLSLLYRVVNDSPPETLAFSPDGQWLMAGFGHDQPLQRWRFEDSAFETEVLIDGLGTIFSISFSPDSRILAAIYQHPDVANRLPVVEIIDMRTNTTLIEWEAFEGLSRLSFSVDGTLLALIGYDRIQLWDIYAE